MGKSKQNKEIVRNIEVFISSVGPFFLFWNFFFLENQVKEGTHKKVCIHCLIGKFIFLSKWKQNNINKQ